jgi:hypothetical protein
MKNIIHFIFPYFPYFHFSFFFSLPLFLFPFSFCFLSFFVFFIPFPFLFFFSPFLFPSISPVGLLVQSIAVVGDAGRW